MIVHLTFHNIGDIFGMLRFTVRRVSVVQGTDQSGPEGVMTHRRKQLKQTERTLMFAAPKHQLISRPPLGNHLTEVISALWAYHRQMSSCTFVKARTHSAMKGMSKCHIDVYFQCPPTWRLQVLPWPTVILVGGRTSFPKSFRLLLYIH